MADAAMNRSNDMDDDEEEYDAPPPRPSWQDAQPANEVQSKAWMGYINETFDTYKVQTIPMTAIVSIVCQKIPGLRPENYYSLFAQVERFIRESPSFELRKGKNGGVFRKSQAEMVKDRIQAIKHGTLPAPIHNVVAVTVSDNYTCKGCGNTKLHDKNDKSCWSCGRTVGT